MALYSEKVMDHFMNPRNMGKMEDADGIGEVGNAKCGDIMRMYLKVDKETQTVTDAKFITVWLSSSTFRYIRMMSPHLALPTSPMPSASSILPIFRGFMKWSMTLSLYSAILMASFIVLKN